MTEIPPPPPPPSIPAGGAPVPGGTPGASKGLAITSLITGALSIFVCCYWFLGIPLGIAGAVTGFLGLQKGQPKGLALTGLILGGVGVLLGIIVAIMTFSGTGIVEYCNDNPSNPFCQGQ